MKPNTSSIPEYYKLRSPYYDRVYTYPERQNDLRFLESYIPERFTDMKVLEVASGTGYWTQFISRKAGSILCTDLVAEPLEQIKQRDLQCPVAIRTQDAYKLSQIGREFEGIFSALWISHIPKQKLKDFFSQLHQCAQDQCTIILLDNSKAQCKQLPVTSTDEFGNSYQDRILDDGSVHVVLKNFPEKDELINAIGPGATNPNYTALEHFWMLEYTLVN